MKANKSKSIKTIEVLIKRLNYIRHDILKISGSFRLSELLKIEKESAYEKFLLPKKNGGKRIIHSPNKELAFLQYCLSLLLKDYYIPNSHACGFIEGKSILTNAQFHINKDIVYTIDLENYFTTINSQRIVEVLMRRPFRFSYIVAVFIANLTTVSVSDKLRVLPQGAPSSPLITNIVSDRLDLRLSKLSENYSLGYSRYVDDITFSFNFENLKRWNSHGFRKGLKQIIEEIIAEEGFTINQKKTRVSFHTQKQMVTGLVVNTKPNIPRVQIKKLRTILHNWEVDGYIIASHKFFKNREESNSRIKTFSYMENVIAGYLSYIEMVKGVNDSTLLKLKERYNALKVRDKLFVLNNNSLVTTKKKLPNIFIDRPRYIVNKDIVKTGDWYIVDRRPFNEEEKQMVRSLIVLPSTYGNSVEFILINGKTKYIPLSQDSTIGVGDSFDVGKAQILTLRKQGRRDIWRIEI